ncbi:hypothetical protein GLAREA_06192 [Glarea lozoyensis ATCC 20868]|uniref:Uncharacterized protein n=2 Tax=Glarea lozoyensis TaxID=101852 RepID=S3D605_GLAL2|nr:uncharacterized protein GLAREA_06192 [Glarea lozoyensis ATCC 20868]EHL00480.1 hypothetical protein M7I_3564 [Glarea lozoyensis 74030]EPE33180.1 hypothetical protein GLAREA_06192 [Glarea lozoyensis ATCC 20868]
MHTKLILLLSTLTLSLFVTAVPAEVPAAEVTTGIKCCISGCTSCNTWKCQNCWAWPYSVCCATILAKKRDGDGNDVFLNMKGEVITMVDMPEPEFGENVAEA